VVTKKERDWVVSIFARTRNTRGKMRGYEIEITLPAKSAIEATKKASDMVIADTHFWAKK